ncbi:MAG: hypothetical protein JWM31_3520 [Solirubrobacterales bacterium]|nr:hypothetical protein [Solirubrobacterales bacterium]
MTNVRRRTRSTLATLAGLVVLGAPTAASAAPGRTCAQLTVGTSKVDTPSVKVVEVRSTDRRLKGSRLFGCVKPDGPVRLLGVNGYFTNQDPDPIYYTDRETELVSVAGRFVTVAQYYSTDANAGPDFRSVVDLRTGRSRQYYSGLISSCGQDPTPPVVREVLGADGRLLALYGNPADPRARGCDAYRNGDKDELRSVGFDGRLQVLDFAPAASIDPASLTLRNATATWTRSGQPQRARVSGTARPAPRYPVPAGVSCASLARRTNLSPVRRLRVARLGTSFVGCEPGSLSNAVFSLGSASGRAQLKIDRVMGPTLAYTFTRGHRVTMSFLSLETGARSIYWDADLAVDCAHGNRAVTPPPVAVAAVTDLGMVVLFAARDAAEAACYPNPGQELLQGFTSGDPVTFDLAPAGSIPASSLAVRGDDVRWVRDGAPRSGSLR